MPDFKLADAEFDRQAAILEALVGAVEFIGRQDPNNPLTIGATSLAGLPAGSQNTMAASAIVLLAAHFEEYIRQQVEEFAHAAVAVYAFMEIEHQEKWLDNYWRAGSNRLNRIRPKGDPTWATGAQTLLLSLLEYPVRQNVGSFIANMLAEHDNNMRWDTIAETTGRVGAQKLSDKLFKSAALKTEIGNPKKDQFALSMRSKLNEFYAMRNGIVHSISQNSGIGPTIFYSWIRFFRVFTTSFADAMEECYSDFCAKIEKNRQKTAGANTAAST
ncbi:MAG: HEPN domain-containing protein [Pseudomonadota bacterium]